MPNKPMTSIFYGWVIVAGVSVILSLQWGCIDTYGIFLTELHGDLGWTKTAISGAYSLFSIISGFTWGSLTLFPAIAADWFGTKFHGSIYGAFEIGFGIAGGVAPLLAGYIFDTRGSYELAIIIVATGLFIAMGLSCVISSPQEQAGFS